MFSLKMLSFCRWLCLFSFGFLIAEVVERRDGNNNDKIYLKYARGILLVIGIAIMIWLIFNKEMFHWNYDIATGEEVDHYSTYLNCVIYAILANVSNTVAMLIGKKNHIKE